MVPFEESMEAFLPLFPREKGRRQTEATSASFTQSVLSTASHEFVVIALCGAGLKAA